MWGRWTEGCRAWLAGSGLQLQRCFSSVKSWSGAGVGAESSQVTLDFIPSLHIPCGKRCDRVGSCYTPLFLVSPGAWKLFLATSEPMRALCPPHFSVFPVLLHKSVSAAHSGCSPGAQKEHLASVLLHAGFFGTQVKVGVITFMNHCGNREILFFIDLCSMALISISTLSGYGKPYEHHSFKQ